jgi:molybdenum cofactor biosynthesis enzyme MoaA
MTAEEYTKPKASLSGILQANWQAAPGWRLLTLRAEASQARLVFADSRGRQLEFRVSDPGASSRRGPFDWPGLSIAYLPGDVAFSELEPVGMALRERLRGVPVGDLLGQLQTSAARPKLPLVWPWTAVGAEAMALLEALDPRVVAGLARADWPEDLAMAAQARGFQMETQRDRSSAPEPPPLELPQAVPGTQAQAGDQAQPQPHASLGEDWAAKARQKLVGHSELSLRLGDLLGQDQLPPWRCALPWTRLELAQGGTVGPCCVEYQALRSPADAEPQELWNGAAMQGFRQAMAQVGRSGGLPRTCLATCPVWQGRTEPPADVRLVGGPIEAVDSQIRTVQAMLRGDAQVGGAPLSVCLTVTSFCNYDCLMCPLGEEGVLDDQLTPMFYQALRPMLAGVQVLEVNGGEPMASPHFRSFLEQLDRRDLPQLRVNMISNGSYLGEKQLQKLRHVPWGNLTLSLNAASADAYRLVNRGLDFARIRSNLDALAALRRAGELQTQLTYSLVVLKQNVGEIGRLAEMAAQDGAGVRLMLPFRDRHQSSVLTDRAAMIEALQAMQALTRQLQERGRGREARGVLAQARVLWERLDRGILAPL